MYYFTIKIIIVVAILKYPKYEIQRFHFKCRHLHMKSVEISTKNTEILHGNLADCWVIFNVCLNWIPQTQNWREDHACLLSLFYVMI